MREGDAGIATNQAFVLSGTLYSGNSTSSAGTCAVSVDGGVISLSVSGTSCKVGDAPVVFATIGKSQVPALPAGNYTINSTQFSIGGDAGLHSCRK